MTNLLENIEEKLHDRFGSDFFDIKTPATKAKLDKLDYIKLKNFCSSKYTINKVKR